MNRIILIGNGFDLAHGLKTRYSDFIDEFWQKEIKKIGLKNWKEYENEFISVFPQMSLSKLINDYNSLRKFSDKFKFNNQFLEHLVNKYAEANWVDIENEYYLHLKECLKEFNLKKAEELNKEFEAIKKEFEEYIINVNHELLDRSNIVNNKFGSAIYEDFNRRDFSERYISGVVDYILKRIENDLGILRSGGALSDALKPEEKKLVLGLIDSFDYRKDLWKILIEENNIINFIDLKPDNILLLNFNYTSAAGKYMQPNYKQSEIPTKLIHIHGTVDIISTPIIFGFGDEIDKDYQEIEETNENEYLKNIKSIKYLERFDYKNLLKFINSDVYQVCIMGHSCGNSDRTLLNTLFEHENCVSVKPYYRNKKKIIDSQEVYEDNFSEISMNISRNFKDKALMRDVVVDKSRTEALFE